MADAAHGGQGPGSTAQTPVDPNSTMALAFSIGLTMNPASVSAAGTSSASSVQHGFWFSSGSVRSTLSKFGSTSAKKMYEEVRTQTEFIHTIYEFGMHLHRFDCTKYGFEYWYVLFAFLLYFCTVYNRVFQTVGPGPKFGPLTDFFWAL